MIQKVVSPSNHAVRKANGPRLMKDMRWAAMMVRMYGSNREAFLHLCSMEPSRTRYACLMTAFGF